jgi:protein tyrosine phosphatase (PTP) superfamily phosphohydrolase (DUF442 family)
LSRLFVGPRCRLLHSVSWLAFALAVGGSGAISGPLAAQGPEVAAQSSALPSPAAPILLNERRPLEGLLTGGAPQGPEGYRALAAAGVRTYVDLRTDGELSEETKAAIAAAGLAYERLPIAGEADLDLAKARALAALLRDRTRYPIVVACASGNRVGALLAVEAFWLDGRSPQEAFALGQQAGLTKLEPSVRQLLGLPPAAPQP